MNGTAALRFCAPDVIQALRLVHYGSSLFQLSKFNPVKVKGRSKATHKPFGGLWACPIDSKSGWKDWCIDEPNDTNFDHYFHFRFKEGARVVLIDSYHDLERLPMNSIPEQESGLTDVNWELIASQADAIWLTEKGFNDTFLTEPFQLTNWSCESILLINPERCDFL